jgi:hypothetical protein
MSEFNRTFRTSISSQAPYYYLNADLDMVDVKVGETYYFNSDNDFIYRTARDYNNFYTLDSSSIVDEVVVYAPVKLKASQETVYGPVLLIGGAQSTSSEVVIPYAAPTGYGPKVPPQFSGFPMRIADINSGSVNIFGHSAAKFPYGVTNYGVPDLRTDLKFLSVSILATPPPSYALTINNTNNTLVNYIEPFYGDSWFSVTPLNNTLITFINPVTFALIVNSTNNKLSVFINPVLYLPISEYNRGTTIQINDITNATSYGISVPIGNYSFEGLASVVTALFTGISAPVSMSWDSGANRYSFSSSGPVISVSWFAAEPEQYIYGFTGLEPNSAGTIEATNAPYQVFMLSVNSSNAQITIQDSLLNTYTVTVPLGLYEPTEYGLLVNSLFVNIGAPIRLRYNNSPFVFVFSTTGVNPISISSLSTPARELLGFEGTEPNGLTIVANLAAQISPQMAITLNFNSPVVIRSVTTSTNYPVFVPYARYTANAFASQVNSLFGAIAGCPVTLSWNVGLNRFIFSGGAQTISLLSVESILGFTGLEPDGTTITATNAPSFYTFSGTNTAYTVTVPSGQYSTTTIGSELETQFLNNNITMDVSYAPTAFTFTKQIVPVVGDVGLYQFVNTVPNPTTLTAKIGTLVFGVSATTQSTTTAPVYDPFPETNIYVILDVPLGLYTADGLASILTQLYQNYSPSINISVEYSYSLQRFIFTKQPLAIGDPGAFQFILSYLTDTTTLQSLIGTIPFAVSANPQQTSTAPPPIITPAVGTGVNTTVIIPNGTYTEYELSQVITNLYYIQGYPITVVYDNLINRFTFIKSPVVAGDPGLFEYVLTDGISTTTANIITGLDVNPPPPIVAANPVIANYAPTTPQ